MNRKIKLAVAALLGFSAACSSVKNTPVKDAGEPSASEFGVRADTVHHRIMVMYGVRPPRSPQTVPFEPPTSSPAGAPDAASPAVPDKK